MNPAKRKALEAAGWNIGDAAEFLDMDEQERQLLNVRHCDPDDLARLTSEILDDEDWSGPEGTTPT